MTATMRADRAGFMALGMAFGACCLALVSAGTVLPAQSLRGSHASVQRMASYADREELDSYTTGAAVRDAVERGSLVRLDGNGAYRVHNVSYPYVRPSTRLFVERLSTQYRSTCGETMVVTSAVRPTTEQPWNSVEQSVHPTGIAIDLRKPTASKCRSWLRRTLLALEKAGVIEATEESSPPHFHVAVYGVPYRAYVKRQGGDPGPAIGSPPAAPAPATRVASTRVTSRVASRRTSSRTTYAVRRGDTLWAIARRHQMSVERLMQANRLTKATLRPGQQLIIPQ